MGEAELCSEASARGASTAEFWTVTSASGPLSTAYIAGPALPASDELNCHWTAGALPALWAQAPSSSDMAPTISRAPIRRKALSCGAIELFETRTLFPLPDCPGRRPFVSSPAARAGSGPLAATAKR